VGSLIYAPAELDFFEYVEGAAEPDYSTPASTADPFDPYVKWWRRYRALAAGYYEPLTGRLRDYLFGDRQGAFYSMFAERGLLTPAGRPDTDFARRWMVRESATGVCWIVDFEPRVYDAPLAHVQWYAVALDPGPGNAD
jgi:hypothetical protein